MSVDIYEPLPNDNDSFRLIRIHPASHLEDEIKADLVVARLSENPVYEALSYVWGPPPNDRVVTVNGEELGIRTSLDEFLRVVRGQAEDHRLVYADAICINQADVRERELQVQMMGSIYRDAKAVLAYLGPGDDDSDATLRGAARVSVDDYTITRDSSQGERGFWRQGIFEESELDRCKMAMNDLVHREYWKRAWIIQECLTGREVHLFCGQASVSWDAFVTLYMFLIDKEPRARVYTQGYVVDEWSTITRFDHIAGQRARVHEYPRHLAEVVTHFVAAQSTDPRDMVYAFLGLIKESDANHPRRLMADYTLTPTELYFLAGYAYVYSPKSGSPHRILHALQTMLDVTPGQLLAAIDEVMDPEDLVCPVHWLVGSLTAGDKVGRTFREERKPQDTPYMECFDRDFATLTKLQRERRHI